MLEPVSRLRKLPNFLLPLLLHKQYRIYIHIHLLTYLFNFNYFEEPHFVLMELKRLLLVEWLVVVLVLRVGYSNIPRHHHQYKVSIAENMGGDISSKLQLTSGNSVLISFSALLNNNRTLRSGCITIPNAMMSGYQLRASWPSTVPISHISSIRAEWRNSKGSDNLFVCVELHLISPKLRRLELAGSVTTTQVSLILTIDRLILGLAETVWQLIVYLWIVIIPPLIFTIQTISNNQLLLVLPLKKNDF